MPPALLDFNFGDTPALGFAGSDISFYPPTSILVNHSHRVYHHDSPPAPRSAFASRITTVDAHFAMLSLPRTPIPQIQWPHHLESESSSPAYYSRTMTSVPPPPLRSPFVQPRPGLRQRSAPVYTPGPPRNGRSPLSKLPDELLLSLCAYLPLEDLLSLRRTSTRFVRLCLHPSLHRSLTLLSLPPAPLPHLLHAHVLPSLHHLHLHLFPFPPTSSARSRPTDIVLDLLDRLPPNQLRSLSLPFSAPYLSATDLGRILTRIGGKLEVLDLRGSAVVGSKFLEWICSVGDNGRGLRELDLGFTAISVLPGASTAEELGQGIDLDLDLGHPVSPLVSSTPASVWSSLRKLSLASCTSLSSDVLGAFLARLPASIESLDLSRLEQVTLPALRKMQVVNSDERPTQLREIKLVGIDHLTRSNIRALKRHWEAQRQAAASPLVTGGEFQWNPLPQPKRVWGEPHTPAPASALAGNGFNPIPSHTMPRRIPTLALPGQGSSATLGLGPSQDLPTSPRTPDLCSRSSSSTSAWSLNSAPQPGHSPASQPAVHRGDGPSWSRPSALASHSALWSALSTDASEGIEATPDVWGSKMPDHPYLPSRLDCPTTTSATAPSPLQPRRGSYLASPPLAHDSGSAATAAIAIHITHSAILESEDEEGYRIFIGEVAGAGVGPAVGLGFGLELGTGGPQALGWGRDSGIGAVMGV